MTEKVIRTKDVAEMLGVSINTVRLWREKERGPKFFIKGYGRYYYNETDVRDFAKVMGYEIGA